MRSPTETLLAEVERFLRKTGMAQTAFGDQALGDPNLVSNLRGGRELRHRTLLKVRAFMDTREREIA
jgi:hypothetical protein